MLEKYIGMNLGQEVAQGQAQAPPDIAMQILL